VLQAVPAEAPGKTNALPDRSFYEDRRQFTRSVGAPDLQLLPAINYFVAGFDVFCEQLLANGTFGHCSHPL